MFQFPNNPVDRIDPEKKWPESDDGPQRFDATIDPRKIAALRSHLENSLDQRGLPPAPFDGSKARFGLTHERFEQLATAWIRFLEPPGTDGYEDDTWSGFQKHLNTFHHYKLLIEDINLHFIRERPDVAAEPCKRSIIPLLLLHGWPGHALEFSKVIKPLAHPGPSTPVHIPAFDVVVVSHPGYLFSSSASAHQSTISGNVRGNHSGPEGDLLIKDVARIMDQLMCRLGFETGYAVQAGDWSYHVARQMAVQFPQRCKAVHLNFCPVEPPPLNPMWPLRLASKLFIPRSISTPISQLPALVPRSWFLANPPLGPIGRMAYSLAHHIFGVPALLSPHDKAYILRGMQFDQDGTGYFAMHNTRPSTIGLMMHYEPLAVLAWIAEKWIAWSDEELPDEEILASLTMWWCTDTMPRSIYPYRNRPIRTVQTLKEMQQEMFVKVPTGLTNNPKEIRPTPRAWAEKTVNLEWYREHQVGGHFFASEQPVNFVGDIQDCFASIWKEGKGNK